MEKDLEIVYKYSLDYLAKIGRLPINSTIGKNDCQLSIRLW